MLRISLQWIVQVMTPIDSLQHIVAGKTVQSVSHLCFNASQHVDFILDDSVYTPHLRISRDSGSLLKTTLSAMYPENSDQERLVTDIEAWTIHFRAGHFREVLMAELHTLPAFLVVEKGAFDTNSLIENGHKLFPLSILDKCPEAETDMTEAGKALAFELPTASAFHAFRVTEIVLRRYWDCVSDGQPRPKREAIGNYAKILEDNGLGDPKVIETLKQLANLHRNPIIHPEVTLSVEGAIETLGIARSAISAMLRDMPDT